MASVLPAGVAAFFRPPGELIVEPDSELIARFVAVRDERAFATLVRRHGAMVLAVCRRHSRQATDAEDAFQAVFFALARDAAKIARRESVGGWLYRVAYFLSVKQANRAARTSTEPLLAEPSAAISADPDLGDVKAALDEALDALTDKLRAVAVACLVEGRTNIEAAKLLGIPVGTVDSRLYAARQKLRDRLARRGVTLTMMVTVQTALTAETADAAGRVAVLAETLTFQALQYAAGAFPVGLEPLSSLADGVTTMTGTKSRWLVALVLSTGLLGGAGLGVFNATAQDIDPPKVKPKALAPAKPEAPKTQQPDTPLPTPKSAVDVQAALTTTLPIAANNTMSSSEVFDYFDRSLNLTVRFDTAAFVRRGVSFESLRILQSERKIHLPGVTKLTANDLLREALAQLAEGPATGEGGQSFRLSYRIRGNQVLIIPEYRPATVPGASVNGDVTTMISQEQLAENIYGEPVTLRMKNRPFSEVLDDLREMTGANIVVDSRVKDKIDTKITANFNDARLFTVLKVLGDSCEMRPVVMDNVYYLTTPENAAKLQKEINRDLFGEPQPQTFPQPIAPPSAGPMK